MEDKTFELIEKMYSEMQKGFTELRDGQKKMEKDQKLLGNGLTKLEDRLEDTRKTLFDGYQQNTEQLSEIIHLVTELSDKLEKQEVEIRVIKGGKLNTK